MSLSRQSPALVLTSDNHVNHSLHEKILYQQHQEYSQFVVDFLSLAVAMDKKSPASQSQRPHSVAVDFGASEDETLANNSRKGVVFLICKYNPLVILTSNLLKFLMAVPEKVTRIVPFVQPL